MKRLIRVGFHLLYHNFAWSYDWVASIVSAGSWQDWVRASLPLLPGPKVLELGYGPGHLLEALRQKDLWCVGVDASWQMSRLASRNLEKTGLPVPLLLGYAQNLCFQSACFDQVVATFPSEFILDPNSLAEIHRVLKPGGVLVVLASAWASGSRLDQCLTRWLARPANFSGPQRLDAWLSPFHFAGFITQPQVIDLAIGHVWIILAVKPPTAFD